MAKLVCCLLLVALCSTGLATANLSIKQEQNSENNFCQGCKAMVAFSQKFNPSANRSEYKDIFKNFCELYYPVSTDFQQGPCGPFVEGLYTLLDHVDPIHHCDQIGACGPTQGVSYKLAPEVSLTTPKQADAICKFCEQSVDQVKTALSDPETIAQVRRQADQLCDYFKVVDADKECHQLVNKYLDQAIKFIHGIDPQAYCRSVQLCSAVQQARPLAKKSGASRSRVLNAVASSLLPKQLPTLVDFSQFGIETSVTNGGDKEASKQQKRFKTPNCLLCKTVVKELFHFLRENKTEANIVKGLDEVCQLIFHKGEQFDECKSMVGAYTEELIQLLIQETDPEMICMLLEQCASRRIDGFRKSTEKKASQLAALDVTPLVAPKKSIDLGDLINKIDPTVKLRSARVCFECKMFIKYLRSVIDEPDSRDYIKQWLLENLCQRIPEKGTQDECTQLVNNYTDTFCAAVIGSLNPSAACSNLGACTKKTIGQMLQIDTLAPFNKPDELPSLMFSPKVEQQVSSASLVTPQQQLAKVTSQPCDMCIDIVTQIDEYMATHPIGKDVTELINQVCDRIPQGSTRAECVYLIEMFGADIAQAIATMDNPRQLCSQIMLCQAA